jgi:hypothetical protein
MMPSVTFEGKNWGLREVDAVTLACIAILSVPANTVAFTNRKNRKLIFL